MENSNGGKNSGGSVDSDEIDFHEMYKDVWWVEDGPIRGLHELNKLRLPLVEDGLLKCCTKLHGVKNDIAPLKGCDILEVGCGGGIFTEVLAKTGANITGVDASEGLIELAKEHAAPSNFTNLNYVYDTIENYSEHHQEKFDAVVLTEIMEHITEKELFLKSCLKTLRPGGSVFITTFNKNFLTWFGGIICAEYIFKCVPKGTHQYDKFISLDDLTLMMEKLDCVTESSKGLFYNVFKNEWLWTSSTYFHYAIQYVKKF